MRVFLIILFNIAVYSSLIAQCNTVLNKFLPESAVDNKDRFGSSLAATDQFMLIGAENSDTLGILYAGAAFLYERTAAGWAYRAMLTASDPDEYDFFGNDVEIAPDGNTIFVINRNYNKGGLYIYNKPAAGWVTMKESSKIEFPDYFEWDTKLSIKSDNSTLVVGSPYTPQSKFYILAKPSTGWDHTATPLIITEPFGTEKSLLGAEVLIHGDYIFVTSDFDSEGCGIYVYKIENTTYQYIARLSISTPIGSTGYFGRYLTATDNMVATMGLVYLPDGTGGQKLFIFRKNGEWTDATETHQIQLTGFENAYRFPYPIQFISSEEIIASVMIDEGESYTGKVVLAKAANETWESVSTEIIFEEKGLNERSEFSGRMVWNGTDLVRSVSMKPVGLSKRNAIVSLTKSGNSWGSEQYIGIDRYNGSDFRFGTAVLKKGDILFSGSPYDGLVGRGAGAVYIYSKSGDQFIKSGKILPSPRSIRKTGGSDAGFGYSLAVNSDELAIGAPSYKYSESSYGKIFIYKKVAGSWDELVLADSLMTPQESFLNHVGTKIAMNDNVLFASAYNNFNDAHTNAVVVFEKINGKWQYQDVLEFGKPLDKSWPQISLSLHGNQLMVGSHFSINGGAFLVSKNSETGKWKVNVAIGAGVYSGFGSAVKLLENHLFIGAPGYENQGIKKAGAVLVYAKLPGQEWNSLMTPVKTITPDIPIEGSYFGSAIDIIGNTLVVGAPGKFLAEDFQVRTIPGNTYIFQTEDYYWHNTIEYLNLQGDRYNTDERDYFGAAVGVDEEFFYIGSNNENTPAGTFSGATYYIPTPPVLFLIPPVCATDIVQLKGYPFGGVWSGPGIEDPSGIFNPNLVGSGMVSLTYETPNCAFEGSIQIEVWSPIIVDQLSPAVVQICSETQVTLQLSANDGASYEWYFKPEGSTDYQFMKKGEAAIQVSNPGQYKATVYNAVCSIVSAPFTVSVEGNDAILTSPEIVCSHNQRIALDTSIGRNGIWSGVGVENNQFKSGNLENGFYQLQYNFSTPSGCSVTLKDSIKISVVEPVSLTRLPGDYCLTGIAMLQANTPDESFSYQWYYGSISESDLSPILKPLENPAIVYDPGLYSVKVTNGDCTVQSDTLDIGFNNDLIYDFLQEEHDFVLCDEPQYELVVHSREGTEFSWYYASEDQTGFNPVVNEKDGNLQINKAGKYKVSGYFGFCSFESKPMSIEFKTDSLFAPNVFTPNEDLYNQTFKIETGLAPPQLLVFNRYGQQLYFSDKGEWDGGNHPAGTYYWVATYQGCKNTVKEVKGWVQIIR